jgi:ADP-ribose pyrophosphatase
MDADEADERRHRFVRPKLVLDRLHVLHRLGKDRMILMMTSHVEREIPYEGRLFDVEIVEVVGPDGRSRRREVVRHPGAVVILPILPDGRIVLIRNYRIAVEERLWELPAGKLERGEDPQHAAARELEEEAGFEAASIRALGSFLTSPGFADERIEAFVAEDLVEVGQRLEPGEDIDVEVKSPDEALAMIDGGKIRDAKTICTLLMWDRMRRRDD